MSKEARRTRKLRVPASNPRLEKALRQIARARAMAPTHRAVATLQAADGVCEVCGQRRPALVAVSAPNPQGFIAVCTKDFSQGRCS